jgi:TATA-box binding protein (TBP) (component of TFIID and TFIIIB)
MPEDIQYIDQNVFSLNGLPIDMIISTISVTGKINCKINLDNINKYVKLSNDYIISIKYAGKFRYLETRKSKAKKKDLKCFENQLTMEIRVSHNKQINIKLFKNGSFQMTGCKSINDCNIVLNKLISKLKNKIAIYDLTTNKIVEKPFIEDIDNGNSEEVKVYGFKIDMINSNFSVNYLINREILYNILLNNKVNCRYEPCIHACVNIKYPIENDPNNKVVSIFVFQSGNIIITGARTREQINSSYNYITNILTIHHDRIVKKDLINMLDNNDLKEILAELDVINMDDNTEEIEDNILV